jgi:hypothetical protein
MVLHAVAKPRAKAHIAVRVAPVAISRHSAGQHLGLAETGTIKAPQYGLLLIERHYLTQTHLRAWH